MALPPDVRALLRAPNFVHLSTMRANGAPRNHVVWVGLEGENVLVCTSDHTWKAADMRRDPRVSLSVVDSRDPYRMAALQGLVTEIRDDRACRYMDPIAIKYTGRPFPHRGPDRVCFVIAPVKAAARTLDWLQARGEVGEASHGGDLATEIASVIAGFVSSTGALSASLAGGDEVGVLLALEQLETARDRAFRLVRGV